MRALIDPRTTRRGFDLVLLFCLAWLATLLPLMPHRVATLWLWGALSGACLVLTSWLLFHLGQHRHAIGSLLGCSALISMSSLGDFWHRAPVLLLAQCRSSGDGGFFTGIGRHIEFHWQWFPLTTVAMLFWIFLSYQAAPESMKGAGCWNTIRRTLKRQVLPRLVNSLFMFFCMGVAMSGVEALGIRVQGQMSADGLLCGMLCGMSLYHLLMQVKFWEVVSNGTEK
ncbi:hypothetical protein [Massilia sp. S19_KUP03_FR1]|uniref:hypothetical protein n=1 Tax=Massilia sp. S19_KUP03_FR1 TaxID=3025503 RepID=UPI002FCD8C51